MSAGVDRPVLSAPGGWDRYYQVNADLDPLLGTPGISSAFGDTVEAATGSFRQIARGGFFLEAARPVQEDPAALSAELAGAPRSGAFAGVVGSRRTRARRTVTGTHAQFEQIVRGARLIGGDLRIHHDESGVYAVTGRPLGDLAARDPGEAPELESREALETCAERFELDDLRAAHVEQVVFPQTDGATWAYEVAFVVPEHAADVRVYLKADDLSLLLSCNISSSASLDQGQAEVHAINPLQSKTLTPVTLDSLDAPGNLLRGPSIDVTQAAGARMDRPSRDFTTDPGKTEFDEPQVYHHVSRATEYFRGITSAGLMAAAPFTPIRVLVNDPESVNNAYYAPSTGELRFGLFGSRSSARSASMVIHELGHAITDAICRLGRSLVQNTPARGLSEGFSDYFAASLLDDPRFADYVVDDPHGARNCADVVRFPTGFVGEEHETGAAWASVLWAIRSAIGQAKCDQLVVESLDFLDSTSTFEDALIALHTVDTTLNGEANMDVIDHAFDARRP